MLLLFAQQGATMHGISHVADAAQQEQQFPHSQFCDQCSSYAQIAGVAPQGQPVFATAEPGGSALLADAAPACASPIALAFHSRAPPIPD